MSLLTATARTRLVLLTYGRRAAGAPRRLAAAASTKHASAAGASRPWQDTLRRFAGTDRVDAAAMLEYFAPLREWLARENAGRACGWSEPSHEPATS